MIGPLAAYGEKARAWIVARSGWTLAVLALVLLTGMGLVWSQLNYRGLPDGIAGSNGRIEAVEIDVAARSPGRLKEILVNEGDFVRSGQPLARMDIAVLEAQRREAEAQLKRAVIAVDTAKAQVVQRHAEHRATLAVVAQRRAEQEANVHRFSRSEELASKQVTSQQVLDDNRARMESGKAAIGAAEAQVAAAEAAISAAQSQIVNAEAAVEAAKATIERIQADIDDATLVSPRDGRVQYRVSQPGEVVGAGGKILNLVDLGDVYMTFFLPTASAGRIRLGAEARIILDAAPQYVIPAKVSFVADVAQFTPKTVETPEERQKLMFRIKARIDPALLQKHLTQVKTGLPGMAYVRFDDKDEWPAHLRVKIPQ